MSKSFIFNLNKCVGCQACAVACQNENHTDCYVNWREINTFNKPQHPAIPVFHLSLACNHCAEPLCLKNCPALAYTKDPLTGAVIHHANRCIGCQYCTWACPFDAPKFNRRKHIVEKCTFCNERIKNGLKPACASLCPTGALDFGEVKTIENQKVVRAFIPTEIQPKIHLIPLRKNSPPEMEYPKIYQPEYQYALDFTEPKISLKKEWILVIFTLLAATLVGIFIAGLFAPMLVDKKLFVGIAIFSMLLSALHLGKKLRAYRSIFNLRNSWLSREIFFYSGFVGLSSVYLFYFPQYQVLAWLAAISGIIATISIDQIYHVFRHESIIELHSSSIFLTAIFFCGLILHEPLIWLPLAIMKVSLFVYQNFEMFPNPTKKYLFYSLRLDIMLSIPFILWLVNVKNPAWYWLCIFVGEIFDRCIFYYDAEIITPQIHLNEEITQK